MKQWIVRRIGREEWLQLVDARLGMACDWVTLPADATRFPTRRGAETLAAFFPGVMIETVDDA